MKNLNAIVTRFVKDVLANEDKLLVEIIAQRNKIHDTVSDELSIQNWKATDYSPPPPPHVKRAILKRLSVPGIVWIETGTYKADTTKFLSQFAKFVYSIEPDKNLYDAALVATKDIKNIQLFNGTSEFVLPKLLKKIKFKQTGFWLDGHYSGQGTFRGENDTPINHELAAISNYQQGNDGEVRILIDDIRLFTGKIHSYGPYPTLDRLVDWARDLRLSWSIEQDIFIAKSR
jgi:hypothetical protein